MNQPCTDTILQSISDGVFTIDCDWRISSFNRAAEQIIGISREEALGKRCHEVFKSNMCEKGCPLRKTLKSGKELIDQKGWCLRPDGQRIPISVSTACLYNDDGSLSGGVETFRDLRELEQLREKISNRDTGMDSHSPVMKEILSRLEPIAQSGSTVLIQGETGTGKEVLARAIHANSAKKEGPFVAINCAALPESLLESELFGYRKGAFTGADRDKPGLVKRASGGTLFLDEIGDMAPSLQVKILRVLQEREYEVLGSQHSEKTDARIICATNRDLEAMISSGGFRQDLFYRINVISLSLPPLRERREDLPLLAQGFLRRFREYNPRSIEGFSPEVFECFYRYPWPGNIRELENTVERAIVLSRGPLIELEDLPPNVRMDTDSLSRPKHRGGIPMEKEAAERDRETSSLRGARERIEKEYILEALTAAKGNKSRAAELLGMDRSTLYRKLKQSSD